MFRAVMYRRDSAEPRYSVTLRYWISAKAVLDSYLAQHPEKYTGGTVEQWVYGMRSWCLCEEDPAI